MDEPHDNPRAFGLPKSTAAIKSEPADFRVEEVLPYELTGEGEHLCLLVEKCGLTTDETARLLARHYHLTRREVSYAGMKDKQAVTRQWFSLRVGAKGRLPFDLPDHPGLAVIRQARHRRKIRRGSHRANRFSIRLRSFEGSSEELEARLARVARRGAPNYFGPQRFGNDGDNVAQALEWFSGGRKPRGRFHRGILLSAARAWLFNHLLAGRVATGYWDSYLDGDILSLDGSTRCFTPEAMDSTLKSRFERLDVHPSGPLWGKGEVPTRGAAGVLERTLARDWPGLCDGLAGQGLVQERRPLRILVGEPRISNAAGGDLVVEFTLPKGGYATVILRELVNLESDKK